MSYFINGVACDTYTSLDRPRVGNPVMIRMAEAASRNIVTYLYCNHDEFPVNSDMGLTVQCCMRSRQGEAEVECLIGSRGEILIPLPEALRSARQSIACEINLSGTIDGEYYRCKAFDFIVVIIP